MWYSAGVPSLAAPRHQYNRLEIRLHDDCGSAMLRLPQGRGFDVATRRPHPLTFALVLHVYRRSLVRPLRCINDARRRLSFATAKSQHYHRFSDRAAAWPKRNTTLARTDKRSFSSNFGTPVPSFVRPPRPVSGSVASQNNLERIPKRSYRFRIHTARRTPTMLIPRNVCVSP